MTTINSKHLSILKNLIESGFKEEKQIASIGLNEAARLPRCCRVDLVGVLECIQAVKSNKLLSYLSEEVSDDVSTESEVSDET